MGMIAAEKSAHLRHVLIKVSCAFWLHMPARWALFLELQDPQKIESNLVLIRSNQGNYHSTQVIFKISSWWWSWYPLRFPNYHRSCRYNIWLVVSTLFSALFGMIPNDNIILNCSQWCHGDLHISISSQHGWMVGTSRVLVRRTCHLWYVFQWLPGLENSSAS